MKNIKLRKIAHARAGDKGNISNISVIVYDKKYYELVRQQVTEERIKRLFKEIVQGEVKRYEMPNIHALNFVLHNALGGGVTKSLNLDPHGKSLSSLMLELEVMVED